MGKRRWSFTAFLRVSLNRAGARTTEAGDVMKRLKVPAAFKRLRSALIRSASGSKRCETGPFLMQDSTRFLSFQSRSQNDVKKNMEEAPPGLHFTLIIFLWTPMDKLSLACPDLNTFRYSNATAGGRNWIQSSSTYTGVRSRLGDFIGRVRVGYNCCPHFITNTPQ